MNQVELIEKLKLVAEYDGYDISGMYISEIKTYSPSQNIYEEYEEERPIGFLDLKYHTSFDWSIPVWNKLCNECNDKLDIIFPFYSEQLKNINNNDPLQFFISLTDLISELKKH